MKVGVVSFPGSNCDEDALLAVVEQLDEEAVLLWHKDHDLQGADVIILPGGFSYGDYLRAGAIARFSPIMQEVIAHAKRGGPVIGICNGFQIACEAGLLPGALLRNASLQFRSMPVTLRVESTETVFTRAATNGSRLTMPIAHGDGRYTADDATLDRLEGEGRVALRYGESVNGSARGIAGILNDAGNVLGLMPHPERAFEPAHGGTDGRRMFEGLLEAVA